MNIYYNPSKKMTINKVLQIFQVHTGFSCSKEKEKISIYKGKFGQSELKEINKLYPSTSKIKNMKKSSSQDYYRLCTYHNEQQMNKLIRKIQKIKKQKIQEEKKKIMEKNIFYKGEHNWSKYGDWSRSTREDTKYIFKPKFNMYEWCDEQYH